MVLLLDMVLLLEIYFKEFSNKIKSQSRQKRQKVYSSVIYQMNSPRQTAKKEIFNLKNISQNQPLIGIYTNSPRNPNRHEQTKIIKKDKEQAPLKQKTTITFQNGDIYQGSLLEGKFSAKATYSYTKKNLIYIGGFKDNYFHGQGVIRLISEPDSIIYEGSFLKGLKHGQGKYYYGPDHYYNGSWAFDKKEGRGIYQYTGGIYNGEWKENKKHGTGKLKLKDGTYFKGKFENDQLIAGSVIYPNSDQYSGSFVDCCREGEGQYFSSKTKERYKGAWIKNKKHGKGKLYLSNGDQFEGIFQNGSVDETESCTLRWNSGKDKGTVFVGFFKNGKPSQGHVMKKNGEQFDTY